MSDQGRAEPGSRQRARGRTRCGVAAAAAALLVAACGTAVDAPSSSDPSVPSTGTAPATTLLPAPVSPVPPLLDRQAIDAAVAQLDGLAHSAMERTGVPGMAIAVVYEDEVIYSEGFGVREVGKPEAVDPETVFQVASVSKPLASAVVAGVVGEGVVSWDDPVIDSNPSFALKDPYVTANATFADLFSHRSGLYTGSGDLLEDLGWDRDHILSRLDQQPLDAFRSSYNYSNFGVTEGGVAAAAAKGMSWEDLAEATLFEPLGMTDSSYRHADYESRSNKALIHVEVGEPGSKQWEARYVRDADAEAPAGGASSSVRDLAQFIRAQLGGGTLDGRPIIDPAALQVTHVPHQEISHPTDAAVRTQFYGLGWNVTTDDEGRVRLDHSGAFALGAATNVAMIPGEQLGIVTLTNGSPVGVPEAINNAFFDAAQHGAPTVDWLPYYEGLFRQVFGGEQPGTDYSTPPSDPAPAQGERAYVGTYANAYYGPLDVTFDGERLSMTMGPVDRPTTFALTHYDGDTFSFQTIGENATGLSGAIFTMDGDGTASSVRLEFYEQTGLGTFTRSS
ncbi:MAG: serine hydrolase [Acidimicrobiia bacterium]|nr:serine hydrolase [Acidimicrobiia bacterium]